MDLKPRAFQLPTKLWPGLVTNEILSAWGLYFEPFSSLTIFLVYSHKGKLCCSQAKKQKKWCRRRVPSRVGCQVRQINGMSNSAARQLGMAAVQWETCSRRCVHWYGVETCFGHHWDNVYEQQFLLKGAVCTEEEQRPAVGEAQWIFSQHPGCLNHSSQGWISHHGVNQRVQQMAQIEKHW